MNPSCEINLLLALVVLRVLGYPLVLLRQAVQPSLQVQDLPCVQPIPCLLGHPCHHVHLLALVHPTSVKHSTLLYTLEPTISAASSTTVISQWVYSMSTYYCTLTGGPGSPVLPAGPGSPLAPSGPSGPTSPLAPGFPEPPL